MRAARDQAADENLRILAQAMIGCARRQELWASDFLRYADLLAPLSRDELILIGRLMSEHRKAFGDNLVEANRQREPWLLTSAALTKMFGNIDAVTATAVQAQRSGLLVPYSGTGTAIYALSPLGIRVRQVVNIEAALNRQ
jgi:hypothetical protein